MRGSGLLTTRICAALVTMLCAVAVARADIEPLTLADGTEIDIQKLSHKGLPRVLWLPSEAGAQAGEMAAARALARLGVEVWYADTLSARFLPAVRSSMHELPAGDVVALIERAVREPKPVVVITAGGGAAPLVRALVARGERTPALAGAILLSPHLYVATPEVGADAEFLPETARVKLPIVILQAAQSPWRWRLDSLAAELARGGSRVHTHIVPDVRDRFYFRPNATAAERKAARQLPARLRDTLKTMTANEKQS